jgi:hypothetical protein
VQAASPGGSVLVNKFTDAAKLGTTLNAQTISVNFTNQLFPSADYRPTELYDNYDGYVGYDYNLRTGKSASVSIPTAWMRVVTITVVYTMSGGSSVSWYGSMYQVLNSIGGIITGEEFGIPSNLQDISLPVQMSNLLATYNQEDGVLLEWRTESESSCAGFNILKCENIDGIYDKITSALIPGAGNTSSAQEYSYTDMDVIEGTRYWYKIEQVSTDGSAESYFGPISVQVKAVPKEFALSQNYPNPFNPMTKINVDLPERSNVDVKIYNLLGKEIRTLISENKSAGTLILEWDGKNNDGRIMPSGIYIYKLVAGDQIKFRKMTKIQ